MVTFYKAHKGDYYCRELPYRIFKHRAFWRVQRLTGYPTTDNIELFADRLCMPFGVFHAVIEKALKRPVWTHEFGLNREELQQELLDNKPKPSMQEIMELIPADKRIIVVY